MPEETVIKVEGVSKTFKLPHEKTSSIKGAIVNFWRHKRTYETQQALKDISFEVKKGEFFGIVGRNGSGKSTLLKTLAGIYSPSEGAVSVNGQLTPFIELGVGFNPELTGRENVFLNGALLGFSRKEMQKLYNQIVDFAEIKRFMDQKLKNYSSGMQVRLAFSIAVQVQSDILLIDEVLAVGDAAFQRKCYDYFMSLKKKNQTVVLVTHDMSAIRQYCDRAIMIEAANVVSEGRPEKIAQAYQQLFSNNSSDTDYQVNDGEDRWGTGEMLAEKPVVEVNDKDVIIHTQYVARTKLPAPIYGISIYNGAGDLIADGNTRKLKLTTQGVSNKGKVSIVWRLPNIFASGKHTVSVACCDQSATLFYDWLNGTEFTIDKKENTTALVDPIIKIDSYET